MGISTWGEIKKIKLLLHNSTVTVTNYFLQITILNSVIGSARTSGTQNTVAQKGSGNCSNVYLCVCVRRVVCINIIRRRPEKFSFHALRAASGPQTRTKRAEALGYEHVELCSTSYGDVTEKESDRPV